MAFCLWEQALNDMKTVPTTNPKIGIVIPIIDSGDHIESFVRRYIESIQCYGGASQTVLVCNNSPSRFFQKLKKFENEQLTVVDIGNCEHGIGKARNYGLSLLSDDIQFVSFLDDDDCFINEAMMSLPEWLDTDADIICFGWQLKEPEKNSFVHKSLPRASVVESQYVIDHDLSRYLRLPRDVQFLGYCWGKFYRKSLIDSVPIRFDENLSTFEDVLYVVRALSSCGKVKFVDSALLIQNYFTKSIIHKASFANFDMGRSLGFTKVAKFIQENENLYSPLDGFDKKSLLTRYVGYLFYFSVLRVCRGDKSHGFWVHFVEARKQLSQMIEELDLCKYNVKPETGESVLIGKLHRSKFYSLAIAICIFKARRLHDHGTRL